MKYSNRELLAKVTKNLVNLECPIMVFFVHFSKTLTKPITIIKPLLPRARTIKKHYLIEQKLK